MLEGPDLFREVSLINGSASPFCGKSPPDFKAKMMTHERYYKAQIVNRNGTVEVLISRQEASRTIFIEPITMDRILTEFPRSPCQISVKPCDPTIIPIDQSPNCPRLTQNVTGIVIPMYHGSQFLPEIACFGQILVERRVNYLVGVVLVRVRLVIFHNGLWPCFVSRRIEEEIMEISQ